MPMLPTSDTTPACRRHTQHTITGGKVHAVDSETMTYVEEPFVGPMVEAMAFALQLNCARLGIVHCPRKLRTHTRQVTWRKSASVWSASRSGAELPKQKTGLYPASRSEERRVGTEWVSTFRSRW